MTITLAIDTSTIVCAGLARDGEVIAGASVGDQRSHAELLAETVRELLAGAGLALGDVDQVAIGVGPGPFTGLRVGIATGRTLAWLAGLSARGVCSLDVLAAQWVASDAAPDCDFIVTTDARRKELYWARYGASGVRIGEPQVSAPQALPDLPVGGPGAAVHPEALGDRIATTAPTKLDPGFFAAHAADLPDVGLEPLYLRKPDAEAPSTRKSTLTSTRLRLPRRQS